MENNNFQCKKVKYSNEEYALFDIERIRKKSNRIKVPTRAYFCYCGSWHLTSRIDEKQILISKLRLEIHELKLKVKELSKINKEGLSELEKNERLEIRRDAMILELRTGLKTTQKHNKSLQRTNAELIHKNLMLEKKNLLLESEK